ncbi:DUF4380 domain-containing protein [Gordonia sp. NPDC058843]|uniref:DUF4380 domain-containing protein n=1 Tax=Gordonia sp. NPDC058843 TaxID=3346648 RepID=UPI0036787FD8
MDGSSYPVVWMGNDAITLGVVPALGGRILSARVGDREALWRNPELLGEDLLPVPGHQPAPVSGQLADWRNYGGDKTWPAPQGWSGPQEWAGPPDPVLDSGPYEFMSSTTGDRVTLTMTSEHDPRTGLTMSRTVSVAEGNRFVVDLTGTNTGCEPVQWSLWNVTQLPGGGDVLVAVDDMTVEPVELAVGTHAPQWQPAGESTVRVPGQDVVGKLGFTRATGTMSYTRNDLTVTWMHDVDSSADYPDGGSRTEVWMEYPLSAPLDHLGGLNPPDRIVECEVLSPMTRIQPGESVRLSVLTELTVNGGEAT